MSAIVIDTHILLWYLFDAAKLSPAATQALLQAEADNAPIYVPSMSVVELRYLVEKKSFTEAHYQVVLNVLRDPMQLPTVAQLDLDTADNLMHIPRTAVPELPDRVIAATAFRLKLPLITADTKIRTLTNITII